MQIQMVVNGIQECFSKIFGWRWREVGEGSRKKGGKGEGICEHSKVGSPNLIAPAGQMGLHDIA